MNVCGEWKTDVPEFESAVGIHTHGDGVLHIHPFSQLGVGANATLGRFIEDARDDGGLDVDDLRHEARATSARPSRRARRSARASTTRELRMAYWENVADAASLPEITTGDFNDLRLTENGAGITIFYGDPDADIPQAAVGAPTSPRSGAADGGADAADDPETGQTTTSTTVAGETTTDGRGRHHHDHRGPRSRAMQAVVLVGGFGTRLRPLTLHDPEADAAGGATGR